MVFEFKLDSRAYLRRIKADIDRFYDDDDTMNYAGLTGADIFSYIDPPDNMILTRDENNNRYTLTANGHQFYSEIRFFQQMNCSDVVHEGETPTESSIFTTPTESSTFTTPSTESTPSTKRITIKYGKDDKCVEEEDIKAGEFEYDKSDEDEDMKADEVVKTKGKKRKFRALENDNDTIAERVKSMIQSKRRKHNDGSRSSSRTPSTSKGKSLSREPSTSKEKSSSVATKIVKLIDEYGDKGRFEDAEEFEMYPDENAFPIHECNGFVIDETEEMWGIFTLSDGRGGVLEKQSMEKLSSKDNWSNDVRELMFDTLLNGEVHRLVFE